MVEMYIGYVIGAGIIAFAAYKIVWPKIQKWADKED